MSRLFKITLGAAIGAALAFFFGTERGRRMRGEAERQVLPHLKESGVWIFDEISNPEDAAEDATEALQDKIESVRQRLREQQAARDAQ